MRNNAFIPYFVIALDTVAIKFNFKSGRDKMGLNAVGEDSVR